MNGYQVARAHALAVKLRLLGTFPNSQQWFATGECIAHLEHWPGGGDQLHKKREILYYELYLKMLRYCYCEKQY
jgi:hypothetical protein